MKHLIIGAGQIGPHVARQLMASGADVSVATRSGNGPTDLNIQQLDATDPAAVRRALTDGVDVLHLCLHASAYRADVWRRELPALEKTVLSAAAEAGTTVVFPESVYAFDTRAPVTPDSTIRPRSQLGEVRRDLLAQRAASPAHTVSVIAGDFIGPGADQSHAGPRMWEAVLAGKTVRPLGSADVLHAWTYLPDLASTMIAASQAPQDLLVAPAVHATQRELVAAYARAASTSAPAVKPIPGWALGALGLVSAATRAIASTSYLFTEPLTLDFSQTQANFGINATHLDLIAEETLSRGVQNSLASGH